MILHIHAGMQRTAAGRAGNRLGIVMFEQDRFASQGIQVRRFNHVPEHGQAFGAPLVSGNK